ncbi:MAG: dipeptidyl aminopeptidase/acylaminoacyl peptidase [Bacteroidetes bacterium]|jgi:dipeptidyl-peptidase-4|nr:dipeptidyl aminopeptidase/acylaminoacyl peptidase [Bacteroidota bacterium]
MKCSALFSLTLLLAGNINAQQKNITLEDIWKSGTFRASGVYGLSTMKDGVHYSAFGNTDKDAFILRYEYAKDSKPDTLLKESDLKVDGKVITIDNYSFSPDESRILISSETDQIYRHSTRENYYVYDRKTKTAVAVAKGEKQMYGTFSPDGNKVAFVRDNNIFIKELINGKETQVTNDGKFNSIINGATDWVHEEEFAFSVAYSWSPDSKKIAYYKFDESNVKEFSFNEFNNQLYPTEYKFKYPKAGEANSIVTIHTYDIASGKDKLMDIGKETDQYIPRIKWTIDPNVLSIVRMNRYQNKLDLMMTNASTGSTNIVYSESNEKFIDIHEGEGDYVFFTADGKNFLIQSEKDGFNHLYLFDMSGKLVNQITKGNWDVVELKGIDEKTKTLFYIASETTATEKDIYSIKLDGSGKKKLSAEKGTHAPEFSSGMKYYIDIFSSANTPHTYSIVNAEGKPVRVLENNSALAAKLKEYNMSPKELFMFKTTEGVELNAWMIKPANFDKNKKYPVFLTFYGGPGRNMVNNSFDGRDYYWHQMLAQKGYIVMCVDNRGTLYRGAEFKKSTYKQLGKLEVADQIETAKYLGTLPFVDKTRIGTFGWSYGGYLSSLCITKGADYFKTAIAVAPVTNWRYYDNIYTERFMSLPQENASGYDDNSPINHVKLLKGKYLLIHGSGDDNVHVQNTMEMVSALVAANKQFDLFIYPDKNHSIYGGNTRLHLYNKMTDFIINNL